MKKITKISTLITSFAIVLGFGFMILAPAPVGASAVSEVKSGLDQATPAEEKNSDLMKTINTVINVMLFIVGILSVIMIIFSGIRYVISNGNANQVKSAKDTLMYSIVGLFIAIIAYALVNWVFTTIGNNSASTPANNTSNTPNANNTNAPKGDSIQ